MIYGKGFKILKGVYKMPKMRFLLPLLAVMLLLPSVALAAHGHPSFPKDLGLIWVVPFVCMLLSIAICPLAVPHFWHHHYGKVAVFWGLAFLIPATFVFGFHTVSFFAVETILLEYLPFIILLLSLFTAAGGIRLKGTLVGTPAVNTGLLAFGTIIASWIGTTGAAMLLIRPLLRANKHRKYQVHQVVFFIFLVANIGGSLTPLGDPPLFLGFLKGVDFFWTTVHLFMKTAFISVLLLLIYFFLDSYLFKKEGSPVPAADPKAEKIGLDGKINLLFVACIVGLVLLSGSWKPGISFPIYAGIEVELQNLTRDICLLLVVVLSMKFTSKECRELNDFNWEPIAEVAKLFIGIFLSMIPALAILRAGTEGSLAGLISMVSDPATGEPLNYMYFWLTGLLSSFLDNAPTYLVFFNTAGGDAQYLMGHVSTLAAISAGAVFMGSVTYIGNAPNFMVRSIAENSGVKMPSFFGYMAWSIGILWPIFIITTLIFFL